ncbi:C-type lectin domain family 5 member A-like isoform X2 [Grus americana]|uniref:C-type lectin domain family 5 member A-like isoform X2 n=1 Tax=Grus americana TaxID=9117 RepID=UPI0024081853|nr:C-type lectin domain family 5 member A-like isoform X2 [Grus americana]
MSENVIYAELNLTDSSRPRLQKITDVQGSIYAEVKVQSLDRNAAASYTSSGKSCCSRTRVTVLVAVIILLLVLAVCLILLYYPAASSSPHSKIVTLGLALATETGREPWRPGENNEQNHTGCPQHWQKNEGRCYFFSEKMEKKDWNASRNICTKMKSDLVIIDNEEELKYLQSQSEGHYYLLGLIRSKRENTWKWSNNVEHNTSMFNIEGDTTYYSCAVIGYGKVQTASCDGSITTQNMCEKAADVSEWQKES